MLSPSWLPTSTRCVCASPYGPCQLCRPLVVLACPGSIHALFPSHVHVWPWRNYAFVWAQLDYVPGGGGGRVCGGAPGNHSWSTVFFFFENAWSHLVHRTQCLPQRRGDHYDSLMAIMVPVFLALYGVLEPLRLYLGFSGNVKEKVGYPAAVVERHVSPPFATAHVCMYEVVCVCACA